MPDVPTPPVAPRHPHAITLHGDTRIDDYFWLRNKDTPEVLAYLEAENAYTAAVMAPYKDLEERLYDEIVARILETDETVPARYGDYYYYSRTEEGKQYRIHCRKKDSLEAPEEVILDENQLAEGKPFLGLGVMQVSSDGNLLAYSLDTTGFREYTLHVKDLRTGELLPDTVAKVKSVAWAADNRTLLYAVDDHTKRPYRVYLHRLGDAPAAATLLYEESDERFRVRVWRSRSEQYLLIDSSSHTTSEVRFVDAHAPTGELRIIAPREQDHEYSVDHRGDLFYILTNDAGRNFRLVTAPVADPGRARWTELVPHSDAVMRSSLQVFSSHLVLFEREDGLPHLRVTRLDTGASSRLAFDEPVYAVFPDSNPEFDTPVFRFGYESPTTPRSVYDHDLASGQRALRKRTEVLGGYDPDAYRVERVWATGKDGARVPVSLLYKRALRTGDPQPLLLIGYGSYGFSYPVTFSHARVSLLDRGVAIAIAHVRGGGEMGKKWHDTGRMFHKQNTFDDFVAVAEHLVAAGYTAPDRLVIQGGSAGGLLMGAVANMRPDLFGAIVSEVPFVDVLTTMLDADLPLTVSEYEEWGNPNVAEQYAYMKSYCPYTNLRAAAYPATLVRTSYNDSQVMYWEPAKYVAKLRTLHTGESPLLLHVNMAAGHGGASGRYDRLREIAFTYSFLLWQLGRAD
jgi:oligopeptidase B